MAETLGSVVRDARESKGWTLRQTEAETGIHNAHLSQIETGTIRRPNQPMLWRLAEVLEIDYERLLALAGHTSAQAEARSQRELADALFRGLEDLTEDDQRELLGELEKLRRKRTQ